VLAGTRSTLVGGSEWTLRVEDKPELQQLMGLSRKPETMFAHVNRPAPEGWFLL